MPFDPPGASGTKARFGELLSAFNARVLELAFYWWQPTAVFLFGALLSTGAFFYEPEIFVTALVLTLAATGFVIRERRRIKQIQLVANRQTTELIRANQQLRFEAERRRSAEALVRDAVDSISEAFVIFDEDERLVMCNEQYRRLYPESAEFMKPGARFEDIIRGGALKGQYAEAAGRVEEFVAERLRRRQEASGVVDQRLGDGRWIRVTDRRMKSGGIAGLRVDITDRKQAEAELAASEERAKTQAALLHDAIDALPDGFVLYDREDRVVVTNRRYSELHARNPLCLKGGARFEEIIRSAFEHGEIPARHEHIDDLVRKGVYQHRNPSGAFELSAAGKWLRISERKTSDGGIVAIHSDVTELRRAQDLIRAREEESRRQATILQDAVDALADGLVLYDSNDRIVLFNKRYHELRSFNPAIKVGASFEEVIRSAVAAAEVVTENIEEWVAERMQGHRAPGHTALVDQIGGRWIRISEAKTRDGGTVSVLTDITALKRAQQDTEASRTRMADWADTAGDWFWESDMDGRLTFLSDSFEVATGGKVRDRIGKLRIDLSPAQNADRQKFQAHLAANAASQPFRDFVVETEVLGKRRHMSMSGKPLFDNGRFVGYRGSTRDVTAQVDAERAVARQADMLSTLIENLPVGVSLVDRELRLVAFNEPFVAVTGLPVGFVKPGDSMEKVIRYHAEHGEFGSGDPDKIVAERLATMRLPKPRRYEAKRGDRSVEISTRPLSAGGYVAAFTDTSEKRKMERQLAQAQKMEAVGQLTGGIAHDFNNLLGVIVGNLDQQIETLMSAAAAESIAAIKESGEEALNAALRGGELVKRLLAFSRNQPLQPKVLDLREVLTGLKPLLQRSLGDQITVLTACPDHPWPIYADPTQFESAVLNLAINARDAMPTGGNLTIACDTVQLDEAAARATELPVGDYVTITVSDTGKGIPPEILPRVFEPFFTTKEVDKGSGLGLSMVFGYAQQSGGTVKIYSEVGRGTDVCIYLPRSKAEGVDDMAERDETSIPKGNERILIVEDRPEVRTMAVRLLESLGYRTACAENAAAALKVLDHDTEFDLLFTDIMMPGEMLGTDLARDARRRLPNLPIIFTSGFSNPESIVAQATELGATILSKPYRKSQLAARIRAALERVDA